LPALTRFLIVGACRLIFAIRLLVSLYYMYLPVFSSLFENLSHAPLLSPAPSAPPRIPCIEKIRREAAIMSSIAIIGGDERAYRLALLCEKTDSVVTLGLRDEDEQSGGIGEANALLFPYPFSVKGLTVPNLRGLNIDPAVIMAQAKSGAYILYGDGLEPYIAAVEALGKPLKRMRYRDDQLFLQDNADISAEGTICYTMRQLDVGIAGVTVLVTGYGLFGRALAQKLRCLDANVVVTARSEAARLMAREDGMCVVNITEMISVAGEIRVLLNTVPSQIIGEKVLQALPANALLLELASAPFGFDRKTAEDMGLFTAYLPGIPARYAPESAAKALREALNRLMREGE